MEKGMAQVLESVFGRRELDAVSVEEIRALLAEFPSFNAGHYFLSRKLKTGDPVAYAAATRQTALYFNNPLWLQHLLEEPETAREDSASAKPDHLAYQPAFAPVPTENFSATVNEAAHAIQEESPTVHERLEQAEESVPTLNETLAPVSDEQVEAFENAVAAADNEALLDETFGGVNQEPPRAAEDLPQPDPIFDDNPAFEWPSEATADDELMPLSDEDAAASTAEMPAGFSAGLAAAAAELAPAATAENPFDEKKAKSIVFEPYHTIDYFASQGIKLVLEDNPADSFGRQLKSFTEWLKTMKRLPVQPLTGKADETETAEVKNFAAHSVEDRDILTETMAEVLVKQGMTENAVAIYEKLSLIYPLKSAYFAARIEQLKASGK